MIKSEQDLYWLAGLLEGEGCFSVQHYPHNPKSLPVIVLRMTDWDVVVKAGEMLGGNQKLPTTTKRAQNHHKDIYTWRVAGKRAVEVMRWLLPLMGIRRAARIREVLAECGEKDTDCIQDAT